MRRKDPPPSIRANVAVFHVEQEYAQAYARYRRALVQRNRALRDDADNRTISAWDHDLVTAAGFVERHRQTFLTAAKSHLESTIQRLVGVEIDVIYRAGWDTEQDLSAQLTERLMLDRQRGFTSIGPHRADIVFQQTQFRISHFFKQSSILARCFQCQSWADLTPTWKCNEQAIE